MITQGSLSQNLPCPCGGTTAEQYVEWVQNQRMIRTFEFLVYKGQSLFYKHKAGVCGMELPGINLQYSSKKWISAETTSRGRMLQVHERDVRSVFSSVGKSKCNIISIFGRARQGKSFLMNCLAGEIEVFRVSNEKEPCTEGIDISNKWISLTEFSGIDDGRAVNGSCKIGFVDAEGQGDKNVTYDATLVTPILLVSKCVIFNWKGDLQKDHLLETLGIMTKAARNVAQDAEIAETAGTPAQRTKFSHLHITFRDWQATDRNPESVFKALFDVEGTGEAETRDCIRREVLESFISVKVWLFDAPTETVKELRNRLTIDKTSPEFRAQVRDLRAALSAQLKEPIKFAGQPLNGNTITPMIAQIATALNKGETVLPQSAFVSMIKMDIDKLKQQLENDMRTMMALILAGIDEQAGMSSTSIIVNESTAMLQFEDKANEQIVKFNSDMSSILDDLRGDVARQVMSEAPVFLDKLRLTVTEQFVARYKVMYTKWLREARGRGEDHMTGAMDALITQSRAAAVLEDELNKILTIGKAYLVSNEAASSSPDSSSSASSSGINEELGDAIKVITRLWEQLAANARMNNTRLLQEEESQAEAARKKSVAAPSSDASKLNSEKKNPGSCCVIS